MTRPMVVSVHGSMEAAVAEAVRLNAVTASKFPQPVVYRVRKRRSEWRNIPVRRAFGVGRDTWHVFAPHGDIPPRDKVVR